MIQRDGERNIPPRGTLPMSEFVEISCSFVGERNALAVCGCFTEIYPDYYLHLMENGLETEVLSDDLLKNGLTSLILFLAWRFRSEAIALDFELAVTSAEPFRYRKQSGWVRHGTYLYRKHCEDGWIKTCFFPGNRRRAARPPTRDRNIETWDMFYVVQAYFRQGERRPAKLFCCGEEEFALIMAQPDDDMAWLDSLDNDSAQQLAGTEELGDC